MDGSRKDSQRAIEGRGETPAFERLRCKTNPARETKTRERLCDRTESRTVWHRECSGGGRACPTPWGGTVLQGRRGPLDPDPLTGQGDEAWEWPRSLPSWRSLMSSKRTVSVETVEEKGLSRKGLRKTGNKSKGSRKVNHSWRECGIKRRVLRWKSYSWFVRWWEHSRICCRKSRPSDIRIILNWKQLRLNKILYAFFLSSRKGKRILVFFF